MAICSTPLISASISWTGASGGTWGTGSNWSGGVAPTSADDVTINANVTIDLTASQTVKSITIPSGKTVILLNSSASSKNLTLSAGTSAIDGIFQLVPTGQTTTNSARIVMASSGILNISGTLEAGGGSTTANNVTATGGTINITGMLIYYNTLTTTSGTVNVNSGGKIVSKSGSSTTSDATSLIIKSGGTWEHARNGGTIATADYQSGSTLLITGVTTNTTVLAFPSGITSFSTVTFDNAAQTGNITLPNGLTIATLNVNNTGGSGGGVVRIASAGTGASGTLTVSTALNIANGAVFYIMYTNGTATANTGALTIGSGGTITINSGATLGLTDKSSVSGTLTLNGTSALNNNGFLFCSTAYIDGTGSISLNSGGQTRLGDANGIVTSSTTTGNFRNSGSRTYNNAHQWYYNSQSANQVTGSDLPSTCNSFTMSTSVNTLTLTNPLTVTNTLTLIGGKLILGSNNLTAATISGGAAAVYVVTDGAGVLGSPTTAGVLKLFPIGASTTSYDPVEVTPTNGVSFTAKVGAAAPSGVSDNTKMATREWNISATGAGSTVMSLTNGGTAYTPTTASMGHYTGTAWEEFTATYSANKWTATNTSGSFSPFGGGNLGAFNSSVLPIEVANFQVKANQKSALLSWTTASEKDNAYFNIEQSTNGIDFQVISQVKGQGTTATATTYNFEHSTPSVGINYYRLKQVDFNGLATYSGVKSIVFGKTGLVIKNNLVHDALDIITNEDAAAPLSIFNISGQQVFNGKAQGAQRIDVSALPSGLYIVRRATGDVGRFVKQ